MSRPTGRDPGRPPLPTARVQRPRKRLFASDTEWERWEAAAARRHRSIADLARAYFNSLCQQDAKTVEAEGDDCPECVQCGQPIRGLSVEVPQQGHWHLLCHAHHTGGEIYRRACPHDAGTRGGVCELCGDEL